MPRIAVSAPKCAKCGKSVYVAEQVIGPFSRPYHKPCLTCTVCGKRLDSTLLLEHEGEPFCKNCHKAHLGQGKGGFGLAVPLRPGEIPKPPPKPASLNIHGGNLPASSIGSRYDEQVRARQKREEEEMNEQMSGINLSRREDSRPLAPPPPPQPRMPAPSSSTTTSASRAPKVVGTLDDIVASGMEVPMLRGRNGGTERNEIIDSLYGEQDQGHGQDAGLEAPGSSTPFRRQPDLEEKPDAPVPTPQPAHSSSPLSKPTVPAESPSTPSRDTIGSIRLGADGLPPPTRKDPLALARERERGLGGGSAGTAKTYLPRTTPQPGSRSPGKGQDNDFAYSPGSALTKMGLGSTVNAAAVGTPLCARCERPVYFAEQKQAAGRKWHRGCLRCDGCSTTLESGKLEEGPPSAAYDYQTNVWCRPCYAKRFGPKGIGVAGISLPEMSR